MPYYNNYQQSYQPYQQSYQPPMYPQMSQQAQTSGILWVQGDIGARAYPVSPGCSVLLMDSEAQNFYIKSADNTGMPSMKKYSYAEVVDEPARIGVSNADYDTAKLASREEVKALQEEVNRLKNQIATMEVEARNNQSQTMPIVGGVPNVQQTV